MPIRTEGDWDAGSSHLAGARPTSASAARGSVHGCQEAEKPRVRSEAAAKQKEQRRLLRPGSGTLDHLVLSVAASGELKAFAGSRRMRRMQGRDA